MVHRIPSSNGADAMQLNDPSASVVVATIMAASEPPEPPPRNPDKINASLKQIVATTTSDLVSAYTSANKLNKLPVLGFSARGGVYGACAAARKFSAVKDRQTELDDNCRFPRLFSFLLNDDYRDS